MSIIRYDTPLHALVVTKGHPFERDPFFAMFEGMRDVAYSAVEQPAAQTFFRPELAGPYDAFVLYDMPGIRFGAEGLGFVEPDPDYVAGFLELLEAGQGFVFLHHAIAGWPTWHEYAEILGGRFLYKPAELRGSARPGSGYRHDVEHRVSVVDPKHPVTEGLAGGFTITDEVYLYQVFEDDVVPLLRSDHAFVDEGFYSAELATRGQMFSREGWSHPPGSDLIAWAHRYGRSPIVYIACGDSPQAYANAGFRTLLENAIRWVSSDEAHAWARQRRPQA